MLVDDFLNDPFFRAEDLSEPLTLTIESVRKETLGDPPTDKLVVRFKEDDPKLALNQTNLRKLAEELGQNTNSWIGKKVELYRDVTRYGGKDIPCVRVRVPK